MMAKQPRGAIWQVYRDISADLPEQTDPKVASASRRFIKAFQADLAKAKMSLFSNSSITDNDQKPPTYQRK